MGFSSIVDWLISWGDALLESRFKIIVYAIWAVASAVGYLIGFLQYRERQKGAEQLKVIEQQLSDTQKLLDEKEQTLSQRADELQLRESELYQPSE
jgi:hypothetical protein